MERHGLTSFCRRVSHKKTAVLKSVVSKPPFGVRFRLGRVNRTAAHPTVFLYAVSVGGWGVRLNLDKFLLKANYKKISKLSLSQEETTSLARAFSIISTVYSQSQ